MCVDDLPYQELREEYMPKINKERLRWDSVFRKFYNMRIAKKSHKVRQDGLAMKAALLHWICRERSMNQDLRSVSW